MIYVPVPRKEVDHGRRNRDTVVARVPYHLSADRGRGLFAGNESLDTASPLDAADWSSDCAYVRSGCLKDFGKQMAREAKRRRFFEATARAFLGDGLPWNWSIWKSHFRNFTAILDFIHVLSYLFVAAKAVHQAPEEAWSQYLVWIADAGEGRLRRRWKNCGIGRPDWVSLPKKHPTTTCARSSPRRSPTWGTTRSGCITRYHP